MKKQLDIFELMDENPKEEVKLGKIKLTHCLQTPSNNLIEHEFTANTEGSYVNLEKHGKLDKILKVHEDKSSIFYLRYWNDGVV